jgi:serine/threonine protein phosphatase 1
MQTARHFIIGDIHGCFDELMIVTRKIGRKADDMLISLGDIVDRGNKSKEVYHFFRNRPRSVVLMGNHERKHLNGVLNYQLDAFAARLPENGREAFSREANSYPFKTYLFKSSNHNLKVEDLQKSLLTPEKINQLAAALGLAPVEFPPFINTVR